MEYLFSLIQGHETEVVAIATAMVSIATIIYVILTFGLLMENIALRKDRIESF